MLKKVAAALDVSEEVIKEYETDGQIVNNHINAERNVVIVNINISGMEHDQVSGLIAALKGLQEKNG